MHLPGYKLVELYWSERSVVEVWNFSDRAHFIQAVIV